MLPRTPCVQLGDSTRSDRLKKQFSLDALLRDRVGQGAALEAIRALGSNWHGELPAGDGVRRTDMNAAAKAALQALALFGFLRPLLEVWLALDCITI